MSLTDLPLELLLDIVAHVSFNDHLNTLLSSRSSAKAFTPALYARLTPLHASPPEMSKTQLKGHLVSREALTRKTVLAWAIEKGYLGCVQQIDDLEDLSPFINSIKLKTRRLAGRHLGYKEGPGLLPLQLATLHGHTHITRYLLDKGAAVNARGYRSLQAIHFATNVEAFDLLLRAGSSRANPQAGSILVNCLSHGANLDLVRLLIANGEDVEKRGRLYSRRYTSPAAAAIESGQPEALKALLEAGARADQELPQGGHLLYLAIWRVSQRYGHHVACDMVQALLDHGASASSGYVSRPSGAREPVFTPYLFLAIMMPGPPDVAKLLLERGADPHCSYGWMRTCLDPEARKIIAFQDPLSSNLSANLVLATFGHSMRSLHDTIHRIKDADALCKLQLLHDYGVPFDDCPGEDSSLYLALRSEGKNALRMMQMIPHFFRLGADPSSKTYSLTHLHRMALWLNTGTSSGNQVDKAICARPSPMRKIMDELIDRGADVNARASDGVTPLMVLCQRWPSEPTEQMVEALLERKETDVNLVDMDGNTALHFAIYRTLKVHREKHLPTLQLLLNQGPHRLDVNARDGSGYAAIHLILSIRGLFHMMDPSLQHKALRMLLKAGADPCLREPSVPTQEWRPWNRTATTGCTFEKKPPPDCSTGLTPLHLACLAKSPPEFIEILLEHGAGAEVNAIAEPDGLTPHMLLLTRCASREISRKCRDRAALMLEASGADLDVRDREGRTGWERYHALKPANREQVD